MAPARQFRKEALARQEIQPKPPVYLGEWGGEFGITSRRLHVSLPAPSPGVAKAKFRAFRSVGTSGDPTEAACLPGRVGRRIRHYVAQITRVASSAIARSCESEIPCLSSAGPPLLQRSASGRDAWPNRSIIVQ